VNQHCTEELRCNDAASFLYWHPQRSRAPQPCERDPRKTHRNAPSLTSIGSPRHWSECKPSGQGVPVKLCSLYSLLRVVYQQDYTAHLSVKIARISRLMSNSKQSVDRIETKMDGRPWSKPTRTSFSKSRRRTCSSASWTKTETTAIGAGYLAP
jgi:hypothetical protein